MSAFSKLLFSSRVVVLFRDVEGGWWSGWSGGEGARRSTRGFPDVHEVECGSFRIASVVVGWVGLVGERGMVFGIALRRSENGSSDAPCRGNGRERYPG